ncbi:MAG: hypothetical protein AMXMBFR61_18070 [Fimbriimonadales bacterium]
MKLDPLLLAFALTFLQSLGWTYFDGRKRRNPAYRDRVLAGISRIPERQRKILVALFYPQTLHARWVQATVIGTCSLILAVPFYLPLCWLLGANPWACLGVIVLTSYVAANAGEFLLNW